MMDNIDILIAKTRKDYFEAKDFLVSKPDICATTIRSSLENSIKLFYIIKYKYAINYDFNLFNAIEDNRFKPYFDELIINDMHGIRKACNAVIHGKSELTVDKAGDLIDRLKKCINAIEKQLNIDIITPTITQSEIIEKQPVKKICPALLSSDKPEILPLPLIADLKKGFGGKAKDIYISGCNQFGWDINQKNEFGMMRLLYARHATPEDYSVWCLCNIAQVVTSARQIDWDTVDGLFASSKSWANILFNDGSFIYEIWKDIGPTFPDYRGDMTTRLTFIKCSYTNNQYAFGGIYSPIKLEDIVVNGKAYHIKIYERIAETYGK